MKVWEPEICKFIAQVCNHFLLDSGTESCIRLFFVANTTWKMNSNWQTIRYIVLYAIYTLTNNGYIRTLKMEKSRQRTAFLRALVRPLLFCQPFCPLSISFPFRLVFLRISTWMRQVTCHICTWCPLKKQRLPIPKLSVNVLKFQMIALSWVKCPHLRAISQGFMRPQWLHLVYILHLQEWSHIIRNLMDRDGYQGTKGGTQF